MQLKIDEPTEGLEPPVQIYVRKGMDQNERYVSFVIPEWLSQGEIMDRGWAIDGNAVLFVVSKRELRNVEMELIEWFRSKGHPISFS